VKSASNVNIGELYPEELEVVLCLALKCADLGSFRLSYSSYQRWVVGLVKECSMQVSEARPTALPALLPTLGAKSNVGCMAKGREEGLGTIRSR
jgi:hypothetical protein